jgi:SP family facilitated glucose transporter-like MFS transporter 3
MANGYNHSTPLGGDEEGRRLLDENHHAIGYGAAAEQPSMNANTMQHQSQPFGMSDMSATQAMTKSYSVHGEGSLSYLTPLQLGRHELYEMIPFTAVFGMQKKEKNMSKAFASYAADLETIEADQKIFAQTHHHLTLAELDSRRSQASLQLLDELEIDSVLITTPLIIAILVAGLSQFLVGYNTSVMNGCYNYVFLGHYSTLQWSIAVAAFAIGGPLGAILAGKIVDARGRRGALMINSYTFLVGGLVQTFASNMAYLTVGRLIIGCASGFSTVLVPIYLGELAPPILRGTLGTLAQFCLVSGILVSNLMAFPFANERWRVLFAVNAATSIVQILCFPFLIESPRWLLAKDKKSTLARHIIKQLRGLRYDHEVDVEINHFVSASNVQCCDSEERLLPVMLKDKKIRRLLICALFLQMAQQLSGINAVFYYSSMFFEGLIDNPLVGTAIVGAVNCLATYIALLLMEDSNRRTLILWSAGGMFVSSVALVLCLLGYFTRILSLCFVISFVSFFEIGLGKLFNSDDRNSCCCCLSLSQNDESTFALAIGPIPWLIVAEMFEAKYVATASKFLESYLEIKIFAQHRVMCSEIQCLHRAS